MTVETVRGPFAALAAMPEAGLAPPAERQPALLIPGFTGSKEDYLPVLRPLAQAGRRVIAIDMRGQYESPAAADADGYGLAALAADLAAIVDTLAGPGATPAGPGPPPAGPGATARPGPPPAGPGATPAGPGAPPAAPGGTARSGAQHVHLLGHSFGGLVARELVLAGAAGIGSLTMMSSGPGALTGPRAVVLRAVLADLTPAAPGGLAAGVRRVWDTQMEPAAVADGTPAEVIDFHRTRLLRSCPTGLWSMAQGLLACPDRTPALAAAGLPLLVVYGENDDAWAPSIQDEMAQRLGAERVCIPGAGHSLAIEAPETAADVLTRFWNSAETSR